jgi:hypothetical protein
MAYVSSTNASSAVNVPTNLIRGLSNNSTATNACVGSVGPAGGNGLWIYHSTDASSVITQTVNYFTDGKALGMRNGDVMIAAYTSSIGSTTVLLGMGILGTTDSTAGYSLMTGSMMYSTA